MKLSLKLILTVAAIVFLWPIISRAVMGLRNGLMPDTENPTNPVSGKTLMKVGGKTVKLQAESTPAITSFDNVRSPWGYQFFNSLTHVEN